MIIIHAYFNINSQYREEFLKLARELAESSQAEEGNISYQYYEDPEQVNHFIFVEKWQDETAIQKHEETTHFKRFIKETEELFCEPIKAQLYDASVKQ